MKMRELPAVLSPADAKKFQGSFSSGGYDDCWIWQGNSNTDGYGMINVAGMRSVLAHRLSYTMMVGPIPSGLVIDHTCRNHGCINPNHLEPVTQKVNVVDRGIGTVSSVNAAKTHCPKGHPLEVQLKERRRCVTCRRESYIRYNAKRDR